VRTYPVVFTWTQVEVVDGDGVATKVMAMVPLPRYGNVAKRQFEDGESYPLEIVEERSMASHNAYFAAINDGYHNLRENIFYLTNRDGSFKLDEQDQKIVRWPSATHLRKWLLCECGYCDTDEFEYDTPRDAAQAARWIRINSEFAQIKVSGTRVTVKRPHSQSMAAMKKKKFQASKDDTLELLESMIGVRRGTLMKESGRAA
jgi:hypothetical protein